jgi:hypothetical protein
MQEGQDSCVPTTQFYQQSFTKCWTRYGVPPNMLPSVTCFSGRKHHMIFFRPHLARAHLPPEVLGGWTEFVPGRQRQSPDMASIFQGLRGAAPRLSQNFFICRQCMKQPRPSISRSTILGQSSFQRSVRFNTAAANADKATRKASPLASLSQTIATPKGSASARKFFPETSSKSVAYWLLGSAASVFGIVVFGGLTRLTESGYVLARGPFRITIDFE